MRRLAPRGPPGPPGHPVPPHERGYGYEEQEPNHSDLMEAIERGFEEVNKNMEEIRKSFK